MPQNLPEQILQRIVRLLANGNSQREVDRMPGVSQGCISFFATQPRDWPTTSEEAMRFDENLHVTGRPSTTPNGQNEPLHLGSSSANTDDPPIWEVDVISNLSETFSGRRILVSASSQVSQPDVLGLLWSTGDAAVSWSWWMEPWTGIGTSRSWGIKCCHGRRVCLVVTLCTSKTMPRPIQHVTRQPFWTNKMLRSCTGQLGV